jgi:ubiquinone/menaquinone biosynthesis C-methylase UbiE
MFWTGNKHVKKMRNLWNSLNRKSKFGYISHLQAGQKWDPAEFHLTGIRFVDRMAERILNYGEVEPSQATILEIGCGVGRFLKPLSCRFKEVCGVDISEEMLKTAKDYCACLPNITYKLNDGESLNEIHNESFDYCISAGVFQHITDIKVILSYIREALRILKLGGLFLFQFEGNRTEVVGRGQVGAKITARYLDEGLSGSRFNIREVSIDPNDKVRNVVIVIQKPRIEESIDNSLSSFQRFPMSERRWISAVYDDIKTRTSMHERQALPEQRLTFYDE